MAKKTKKAARKVAKQAGVEKRSKTKGTTDTGPKGINRR